MAINIIASLALNIAITPIQEKGNLLISLFRLLRIQPYAKARMINEAGTKKIDLSDACAACVPGLRY